MRRKTPTRVSWALRIAGSNSAAKPRTRNKSDVSRAASPVALALLGNTQRMQQWTTRKQVMLEGVGLHSGKNTRIILSPAPPNSGVVFHLAGHPEAIPAA